MWKIDLSELPFATEYILNCYESSHFSFQNWICFNFVQCVLFLIKNPVEILYTKTIWNSINIKLCVFLLMCSMYLLHYFLKVSGILTSAYRQAKMQMHIKGSLCKVGNTHQRLVILWELSLLYKKKFISCFVLWNKVIH